MIKESSGQSAKERLDEIGKSGDEERNRFIKTIRGANIERKQFLQQLTLKTM